MRSPRLPGAVAPPAEERTPVGINLAVGAVAVVAAAFLAAGIPAGWRFALIPAVVAGFAAVTLDQAALFGVVPLGWLVTNGFLEDRSGELSWHDPADFWLIAVLVVAAAVGLAAGDGYRQLRDLRHRWIREEEEGRDG